METTKKIALDYGLIGQICDHALAQFHSERDISRYSGRELQIYLIISGLERALAAKGIELPIDFVRPKTHDSYPVDESGLGDIS